MSLIIEGEKQIAHELRHFIANFKKICVDRTCANLLPEFEDSVLLNVVTKYYHAQLNIAVKDVNVMAADDAAKSIEGFILIPVSGRTNLNAELYEFSRSVVAADTGLRLLVTFKDGSDDVESSAAPSHYQLWALDNGFEHIEIDRDNLTEGHDVREKVGLARLLEALESNMWSTMQRLAPQSSSAVSVKSTATTFSVPSSGDAANAANKHTTYVPPTVADIDKRSSGSVIVPPSSSSVDRGATSISSSDCASSAPVSVFTGLELPEEKEDDEKLDQFAGLLAQAKNFREKAMSGTISDEERRAQAAALAMQLSQMMCDDEDDDEDSD